MLEVYAAQQSDMNLEDIATTSARAINIVVHHEFPVFSYVIRAPRESECRLYQIYI